MKNPQTKTCNTLLIDNYDSFSYNLYQLIGSLDSSIKVIRNDTHNIEQIASLNPRILIISPGPGKPESSGICIEAIRHFAGKIPILGVCLGHQAICVAFGGIVGYASRIMHGKTSLIDIDSSSVPFLNLEGQIQVARYHSLAITKLPECFKIIGKTQDNEIMAIAHKEYPIYGVQFHPESILTPQGKMMLENIYKNIKGVRND